MANVVLIGAGRMGHRFSQAIRQAGHELSMIFDPGAEPFSMQTEPSLAPLHCRDMDAVKKSDADLYVICTTADHHIPIARELISAGKRRLIIEKPLSQSVADALELKSEAEAAGVRVVVNHGRRYCANTRAVMALDGLAETGALRVIVVKMGGGSLGCVGTHWIDLCNTLMGEKPNEVFARLSETTGQNNRGAQFFDPGGTAYLGYSGQRRAVLEMGDDVGIVGGIDFIFERGQLSWQNEAEKWSLRHRRLEDAKRPLSLYGLPLIDGQFESVPPNLIEYAKAAIADALGDGPVQSGLPEAVDTMEVYAAIRWSDEKNRPVRLPLDEAARAARYAIP